MSQPQLWRTSVEATPDNDYVVDPMSAVGETDQSVYVVGFVLCFDPYEQPKAGDSIWWRLVSASREGTYPYNFSKLFAHFQGQAAVSNPITYAGSIDEPVFVTDGGEALRANFSLSGLLSGFVMFYIAPWDPALGAAV
jgi:hypothetical protein